MLTRTERVGIGAVVLATALAAVTRYASGVSEVVAFACATVALAGLAWVVSFSTEQVGARFGAAVTGFMHATLGNLPEFFVVLFALRAGERVVAETAIVGSILAGALLVLGLVLITGAARATDGVMRFSPRLPNDATTLLLLSTFMIVIVGLATASHDPASRHVRTISIIGAIAILIVYAAWAVQHLSSRGGDDEVIERPRLSPRASVAMLAVAATGSAFVSDWFVHALQPAIRTLHISKAFAGLVIVAIAGNAVENVAGIVLARKGRNNLAVSIVKTSVAQIAAFLYPVLVLVSLLTPTTLTFALSPIYIGALFGTAVIVWQIVGDGEARGFEGAALVATFVILAAVAAFEA